MFNLLLIPHSNVSKEVLDEIIRIKTIAWPYSYEEQIKWINANLKESDIHVLLTINNSFVAYLNLISIDIRINSKLYNNYGIGNVCVKETGKGWGKEIMLHINTFLEKSNKVGILFCKNTLVEFYSICNWETVEDTKLMVNFNLNNIVCMYFNLKQQLQLIEFFGRPF